MYLTHYQLSVEPFAITSDPRFLWLSPQHEEAFAHLLYAVQQRKGFAVLTGGIGTGKTTLINSVLDRLGGSVRSAVLYNASLDTDELFRYIFRDFGLDARARSRSEAVIELNDWLLQQAESETNAVIVVDEAQNLKIETLEDLRLLSNMETARRKLLQIILVGQPELNGKLGQPELAQLQQRIAIRYHLRAFQISETREYVRHRFRVAGGDPSKVFTSDMLDLLHEASGGVPRVINQICDTALLRGYSKGRQTIDADFLREVLVEDFAHRMGGVPGVEPASTSASAKPNASSALSAPARGRGLAWSIVAVLAAVLAGTWFWPSPRTARPVAEHVSEVAEATSAPAQPDTSLLAELQSARSERDRLQQEIADLRRSREEAATRAAATETRPEHAVVHAEPETDSPLAGGTQRVRIRQDDTLMKIVQRHYGRGDWKLIEAVLAANPWIENPNLIRVGDLLTMPAAN